MGTPGHIHFAERLENEGRMPGVSESGGTLGTWGPTIPSSLLPGPALCPLSSPWPRCPSCSLALLSEAEGPAGSGAGRPSVQSWGGAGQGGPTAPEVPSQTPPPHPGQPRTPIPSQRCVSICHPDMGLSRPQIWVQGIRQQVCVSGRDVLYARLGLISSGCRGCLLCLEGKEGTLNLYHS